MQRSERCLSQGACSPRASVRRTWIRAVRTWNGAVLCAALLAGTCCARACPRGHSFTQRRINEFAAELHRARIAVLEAPGSRRPRELLPDYLERLSRPFSGETMPQWRRRMEGYLAALDRAAAAVSEAARPPVLQQNSQENRERWQKIARRVALMPARLKKTRAAWRRSAAAGLPSGIGAEIGQTLALFRAVCDGLRDASP